MILYKIGEEVAKMNKVLRRNIKKHLKTLPKASVIARDSIKGQAKKNWYIRAYDNIKAKYPEDYKLFIGILSSTSPRQHVKLNLRMTEKIYKEYVRQSRPKDLQVIKKIAELSDLPARTSNIIRTFQGKPLSGNKVKSFNDNLLGQSDSVTIDTWMYTYAGIHNDSLQNKSGYIAYSHRIKQASRILNWKPSQVQASIWSYTYSIVNKCRVEDVPEFKI